MRREEPRAKSVRMVYFRTESGMVTSENGDGQLKSPGTMYRKELVSKTGTRLS